jgi:hypothetical protein
VPRIAVGTTGDGGYATTQQCGIDGWSTVEPMKEETKMQRTRQRLPHKIALHLDGNYSPQWVRRRIMVQLGKYIRYLKAFWRGEFSGPEIYQTKIEELAGCKIPDDKVLIASDFKYKIPQ